MNLNLVFPLILAFLSSGQSHTSLIEETSNSCHTLCPAGYRAAVKCVGTETFKCEKCQDNTYTARENTAEKCYRCGTCADPHEIETEPCTFNSDVVCDCKEGYYYDNSRTNYRMCKKCHDKGETHNSDYNRKCSKSKYLNGTKTLAEPQPSVTSRSTNVFTTLFTTTATDTRSTLSSSTHNPNYRHISPKENHIFWVVLLVGMLVLVLGPLLLKKLLTSQGCCWSAKKDVEQHSGNPIFNEQHSHQGNTSTTLTIKISEETPMMTLCQSPSTPEHPAHMSPLLPRTEHKAARQEQSKHLPAFVHYEIIKEVPLRRWKEFLRLLSVDDKQLERAELEAGLGVGLMERQYQMLRLWSQRPCASLNDVFSALHYMDLSGCAQQLQENLEKL